MMATICSSNCVEDVRRPTYVNLYKWPETDAEFIRWVRSESDRQARIVEGISCRQRYLRSYTFSRRQSMVEMTRKWLGKFKKSVSVTIAYGRETKNFIIIIIFKPLAHMITTNSSCLVLPLTKAKQASYAAILSLFCKILSYAGGYKT